MKISKLRSIRRMALFVAGAVLLSAMPIAASADIPQSREEIDLSFAPLVKKSAPAVVNIYTKTVVRERRLSPLFSDPFFKRFFGEGFGFGQGQGQTRERVKNSLGSGVIVRSDGLIVTNHHVIEGADEIRVVLADRREFDAALIGVDERTDLALLRVQSAESLPMIDFRDSDELEVGDLVLAIGNPFGVGQTVTSGIISALARTEVSVADIGSFIQTDAAINPGNSGGALIAMDGRLVGINTAIFSKTGGSLGIGFAVPANMVRFVIDSLEHGGSVVRPWLGAFGQPVTSEIATAFGLDRPIGVLINEIWPGSPAADVGIRQGDIAAFVNEREVHTPAELDFRVGSLPVGGEADIQVFRDGDWVDFSIPLRRAPEDPPRDDTIIEGANPFAGARIANVSPALVEEERLDNRSPGVVMLSIVRGSPAARMRFRPGDYVRLVNGETIESVAQLKDALQRGGDRWEISIERAGRRINLVVG